MLLATSSETASRMNTTLFMVCEKGGSRRGGGTRGRFEARQVECKGDHVVGNILTHSPMGEHNLLHGL
jgi:hypothetical protein